MKERVDSVLNVSPDGAVPSHGLFRPEVVERSVQSQFSTIHIRTTWAHRIVLLLSILIATLLILFVSFGQFSRKSKLPGLVMPEEGLVKTTPPEEGQLVEILVKEGEVVAPGQHLVRLEKQRNTSSGNVAAINSTLLKTQRAALERELIAIEEQSKEKERSLGRRLSSTREELNTALREFDMTKFRVMLAERNVKKYEDLLREGFVSPIQAQEKEEARVDGLLRQEAAERIVKGLQRDAENIEDEVRLGRLELISSKSQLTRNIAALDQELNESDAKTALFLDAPIGGAVSGISGVVGQRVQIGQSLLNIVPNHGGATLLVAQLYGTSRTVGFVKAGQRVWVRFSAFPYQKFGMGKGVVQSVGSTPISVSDLPPGQSQALATASQSNEPLYRIDVRLESQSINAYGRLQPLKPGMTIEADVVQEERSIWEWLLDPAISAWGRAQVYGGN